MYIKILIWNNYIIINKTGFSTPWYAYIVNLLKTLLYKIDSIIYSTFMTE